jgi:hypothetical protein
MSGFLHIIKITMPYQCLAVAYECLRAAGKHGVEAIALFAGIENVDSFHIRKTIIPEQKSMRLEDGLLYSVSGNELHRVNVWLYENGMSLIAQMHSHPAKAYHSDTDDAYPIVATVGGLSIVVPDFGSGKMDIRECAVYRLLPQNGWVELKSKEKESLIELTN